MKYTNYQKQAILERALAYPVSDDVLSEGKVHDSVEDAVIDWLEFDYNAPDAVQILTINELIRGAFVAHWKEINFNKGDLIEYNGQVYAVQALEQALEDFEEQRKN